MKQDSNARYSTLVLWSLWAWTIMTVTHELGHVVAGLIGGANLVRFEIRPWHLPYSLLAADQHPLVTLWAGPVVGCAIPLLVAWALRRRSVWFVAWFCLLANACYLLVGYVSGEPELDSTKMLLAGTPPLVLLAAVAVTLPIGYLRFRRACIELLSEPAAAMSRLQMRRCALALITALVIQTLVGSLLDAQL